MLKVLRKRKRSWVIFSILGAIIVVFVFWGAGNFRTDKSNIVAWVNGKHITATEYAKAYQQQINYYRNLLKEQFNDELLEKMNLRQTTINMLIDAELEFQEAARQGFTVSSEDVQNAIKNVSAFQRDGVFDREQYLQILKANRILPGDYEDNVRDSLVIERLRKKVTDTVNVTDKEIEDTFDNENRKINLRYLVIDGTRFERAAAATDEDSRAYFESNKGRFRVPTQIKAVYISIPFKEISQKVKITEEDIKTYYEKNIGEFQTAKEVSARHILIRPAPGASDVNKAKEEAKKKTEEVLAQARKGEDFAALAKKYSEDTASGRQGGYLGYFKQGDMVKPFEGVAFSLKKGDTSDIVETQFGYHIIKIDDVKEARLIPFREAKDKITKQLAEKGAKIMARELADEIQKAVSSGKAELKDEASRKKIKVIETGFLSARNTDVELVRDAELKKAAFSLKIGETSAVIETVAGVYVVRLIDRNEEHIPPYEEIAGSVKIAVAKEKAGEKAKEAADTVLKRLRDGEDMQSLVAKEGYNTGESGFLTKIQGYINNINMYVGDRPEIFSLTKDKPYYEQVVSHENKFYILKLKESKEADRTGFESKKAEIRNRLLRERQQEALNKWVDELKSKAKIEINEGAI